MNNQRLNKLIEKMKNEGIDEILISDPVAIFYFTDKWIFPGERLLVLYVNTKSDRKLIINELFPQDEDKDLEYVWYNDIDDSVKILSENMTDGKVVGVDKNWPSMFLLKLQEIFTDRNYKNGSILVDELRLIKDEEEMKLMRESSLINDKVMDDLIPWTNKGLSEIELSKKVEEIYKNHGIDSMSFEPITAYGKNGADPHHVTDDTKGKVGDSVVLDIGGMYKNYASDMTRTVFIGEVSDKQKEVYEIVKEANLRGIAAAKPGAKMSDVDKACRDYITEKGYGKYFTHRTGHSIGLEDHEYGDVSSANDSIIKPGQCFSVEPGIYIPEENFGVRIEDLVLITEDGCEVLNKYPKELVVVSND